MFGRNGQHTEAAYAVQMISDPAGRDFRNPLVIGGEQSGSATGKRKYLPVRSGGKAARAAAKPFADPMASIATASAMRRAPPRVLRDAVDSHVVADTPSATMANSEMNIALR